MNDIIRCPWCGDIPIYVEYHDKEWGRPEHDDTKLFEMLMLESMQAGLSWITVLKKREAYIEAFDGFDPLKIVNYDESKINALMQNNGIIRNRMKIYAAIHNAKLFIDIQEKYGSFDKFIWNYSDYRPIVGHYDRIEDIPATTPLSERIYKDLKKLGFKFLGPTTIYAFMQSMGMVNDHLTSCFAYHEIINKY